MLTSHRSTKQKQSQEAAFPDPFTVYRFTRSPSGGFGVSAVYGEKRYYIGVFYEEDRSFRANGAIGSLVHRHHLLHEAIEAGVID